MTKIEFNLSPSALNTYLDSELLFYFIQIAKLQEDTKVVQCYSKSGQCVHQILEDFAHKKFDEKDLKVYFDRMWNDYDLNTLIGMNGKPLDKQVYYDAILRGVDLLNTKYKNYKPEEKIVFPLYEDDNFKIGMKGIIDLPCEVDGKNVICDYKTSSSLPEDGDDSFLRQGKYYSLITYKKHGFVVDEVIFEYLKIKKDKSHKFSEQELLDFEIYLKKIAKEIAMKGTNIENYAIGNIDSIFNGHSKRCIAERERRLDKNTIVATLTDNKLLFASLPDKLKKSMLIKYSYYVSGFQFSELYKKRIWDGKKYLFKKLELPYAFVNDFQQFLIDYNTHFKTNYMFKIIDTRNEKIINKIYNTKFKDSSVELRYYQNDAIEVALDKKIGILYVATAGGKSLIAGEIIKKLNRRTLFLVNRVELCRQTKSVFESYLGVEVGEMSEGNLCIDKQIVVGSIQTIFAILRRNDETSRKLQLYLHNVTLMIADESQNLKNSGMYGTVSATLHNLVYCFGLSGSPWRND